MHLAHSRGLRSRHGQGDRIGSIAPGYDADLIALDGDPLRNFTALERVVFVMKGGRVVKRP